MCFCMLLCLFEQAGSKPDAVSLGDENDFAIAVNHQYQRQVSCIRQVQFFAETFCQLLVVVYLKRQVFRERAEILRVEFRTNFERLAASLKKKHSGEPSASNSALEAPMSRRKWFVGSVPASRMARIPYCFLSKPFMEAGKVICPTTCRISGHSGMVISTVVSLPACTSNGHKSVYRLLRNCAGFR